MLTRVAGFVGFLLVAATARAATPTWVCTTADAPWLEQPAPVDVADPLAVPDVVVRPKAVGQQIDGFGGCFNELGWKALAGLPAAERDGVMDALFGDDGCAFNLARSPIGSSDYALSWYSLDDTPGDLSLAHFSIDRDKGCLIPYIKAAMGHRPGLKVWGSAWSPPAWMKDNGVYHGGHLEQDPATLAAYAAYLARYAEAYRAAGVDVYAVHVQNEPTVASNYPSCLWTPRQERDFIRDHMGPTFRDRQVDAQIWLGTINDGNYNGYPAIVLADPAAAAFVDGVAFQWGGQDAIADCHRFHPNVRLMQSENECGGDQNSMADAEHTFHLIHKYLAGGANSYFYWNMVLQPGGKSSWGWAQNAMVTADPATGRATYHPEFYLMKHLAHFVHRGDHVAVATGDRGDTVAFARADGSSVLVIGNAGNRAVPLTLAVADDGDRVIHATLPSHSFSTFTFPPARH